MNIPPINIGGVSFHPLRLLVSAEVRYWEDAKVNGIADTEDGDNIPLKVGILWEPRIELQTGRVIDWPQGTTASIHYKVCDQGEYWLEDARGNRLKWKGYYVPNDLLAIGDDGDGDYIILDISSDGIIEGWHVPSLNADNWMPVENAKTSPPELWLMPATPIVSTAHVPPEDIPRLDADAAEETKPNGVMGKLDHGWLIHIGDDLDETQWPGYSAAFVALLRLVQSWGFEYLRLDSDGSTLSIPPTTYK